MDATKRKRLEAKGWRVGNAKDFLELDDVDAALVEMRVRLARAFAEARLKRHLTQTQAAKLLGSSQSRVAKLEGADESVSIDLAVRGLLSLGATSKDIARAIERGKAHRAA